jgi:hypothetical protein
MRGAHIRVFFYLEFTKKNKPNLVYMCFLKIIFYLYLDYY